MERKIILLMGMLGILVQPFDVFAQNENKTWQKRLSVNHQRLFDFGGATGASDVMPNIRFIRDRGNGVALYGYWNNLASGSSAPMKLLNPATEEAVYETTAYKNAVSVVNEELASAGSITFSTSYSSIYFSAELNGTEYVAVRAINEDSDVFLKLNTSTGAYEPAGISFTNGAHIYGALSVGVNSVLLLGDFASITGTNGTLSMSDADDHFFVLWNTSTNTVQRVSYPDASFAGYYIGHKNMGTESFALSYGESGQKYYSFPYGGTAWVERSIPALPAGRTLTPDGRTTFVENVSAVYVATVGASSADPIHIMMFNGSVWQTLMTLKNEVSSSSNKVYDVIHDNGFVYVLGTFTHANDEEIQCCDTSEGYVISYRISDGSIQKHPVGGSTFFAVDMRLHRTESDLFLVNNESLFGTSDVYVFREDITPPSAPQISGVTGLRKESSITDSGTTEPFATISYYVNDVMVKTVEANESGSWSTTTDFQDGVHARRVTATDKAGNVSGSSAVLSVTIDTVVEPPALVTADNAETIRGYAFTLQVSGAESGSSVEFFVDGASVGSVSEASGVALKVVTPSLVKAYQWYVRITDTAGNTATSAVRSFTSTSVLPAPTVTLPEGSPFMLGKDLYFQVTSSFGSSFTLTLSSDAKNVIMEGAENEVSFHYFTDAVGTYEVLVQAFDSFGNQSAVTSVGSITVHNVLPLEILSPSDGGEYEIGESVRLEVKGTPGLVAVFTIDGQTHERLTDLVTGKASYVFKCTKVGTFNWSVSITDVHGNTGSVHQGFTVSNAPSSFPVPVFTSPASGSVVARGAPLWINADVPSGTSVELTIEDETETLAVSDESISAVRTFTELGEITIAMRASDGNGNMSPLVEVTVLVTDQLERVPTVLIEDNTELFNLGDEVTILFQDSESVTAVFSVGGGTVEPHLVSVTNGIASFIPPTPSVVGTYTVSIHGVDSFGNKTKSVTVDYEVTDVLPDPVLTAPRESAVSALVGESITLSATAKGDRVRFVAICTDAGEVSDTSFVVGGVGSTELVFPTPGIFVVFVQSFDAFGNQSALLETDIVIEILDRVSSVGKTISGEIRMYPNPVVTGGSLTLEGGVIDSIVLTDLSGRTRMLSIVDGNVSLPEDLLAGNYVLLFSYNDRTISKRLIVR